MRLEINVNHIKANVRNYKSNSLQKFVASGLLALSLFSGSMNVIADDIDPKIEVNQNIKQQLDVYLEEKDNYNASDLNNLLFFSLMIEEDSNLSWLKYCNNLEELMISYGEKVNSMNTTSTIEGLENLKKLSVCSYKNFDEFNEVSYGFLKNCKNLKELDLNGVYVDSNFLEELTSLEVLRIGDNIINYNIDFSKLPNLKEVEFYNLNEYDLATYLDYQTIQKLNNRRVSISTSGIDFDEVMDINYELNKILYDIGVTNIDSDKDKLNAILSYILDKLSYDVQVHNNLQNSTSDKNLVYSFYNNGYLDGALNGNSSICGNYASLFQALASRLGMKSYFLTSDYHAWNLVMIDNEYYYVDPTYLDGVSIDLDNDGKLDVASDIIKSGNGSKLEWYMKNPLEVTDEYHNPNNMPLHIEITPIKVNKDNYSFNDLYKIVVNGKEGIVSLGVVVGIFSLIGLIRKNKDKKNSKKNSK